MAANDKPVNIDRGGIRIKLEFFRTYLKKLPIFLPVFVTKPYQTLAET